MGGEGSDRAGQAGIRLADSDWDGQFGEVNSSSSPSANCWTENSKFNKFLAVTRVAISRQQAGLVGSNVFFNCSSKCTQMPDIKISAHFECIIPSAVAGPTLCLDSWVAVKLQWIIFKVEWEWGKWQLLKRLFNVSEFAQDKLCELWLKL